jgi:hypothetical protein
MRKAICALVLAALAVGMAGCDQDQLRLAAKVANGVAKGIAVVQQENELLYHANVINKDEATQVSLALTAATHANDGFADCLSAIQGKDWVRGSAKSQALSCVDGLDAQLEVIEPRAIGVKNPQAQHSLAVSFQSIHVAVATVRAVLQ